MFGRPSRFFHSMAAQEASLPLDHGYMPSKKKKDKLMKLEAELGNECSLDEMVTNQS